MAESPKKERTPMKEAYSPLDVALGTRYETTPQGRAALRRQGSARHTPGPWRHNPPSGEAHPWKRHTISADCLVAYTVVQLSAEEEEANGRLIAAAPDLLEAAKAVDALVENLFKSVPWGDTVGVDLRALNQAPLALKAAIAKATGLGEREG